jgi:molybdopterin-guanine dinucleotide biosynthesis protein A
MNPSLSAIVLAGGKSSRMGQDKALIGIEGVPLLRRVCEAALQCTSRVYVVTPWIERYREVIPPTCHLIQEQPLPAETRPHGPLVGFAQALAHVETDWVLLLACDLPCLQGKVLQRWAGELQSSGDAIALLPRTEKGWDVLCGFYRTKCLTSLIAAIERGERSFQGWLAQETIKEITVSDPGMLFNCNTREDLAALQTLRDRF